MCLRLCGQIAPDRASPHCYQKCCEVSDLSFTCKEIFALSCRSFAAFSGIARFLVLGVRWRWHDGWLRDQAVWLRGKDSVVYRGEGHFAMV